MATVKKYQNSGPSIKPTKDSTGYYKQKNIEAVKEMSNATTAPGAREASDKQIKAYKNLKRQSLKAKPGYDANGFPLKKGKMGTKVAAKKGMHKMPNGKMMSKMSKKK
jgi:hypothetical protein